MSRHTEYETLRLFYASASILSTGPQTQDTPTQRPAAGAAFRLSYLIYRHLSDEGDRNGAEHRGSREIREAAGSSPAPTGRTTL